MEYNIYLVDSFTKESFKGNPAAVVPDAKRLSEKDMQNIAREINTSETAFVMSTDRDAYKIRFFSPYKEVDFCGHSTLATFYVLALRGYIIPIESGIKSVYIISGKRKLRVEVYFSNYEIENIIVKMGTPEEIGIVEDRDGLLKDLNMGLNDINLYGKFNDIPIVKLGFKYALVPIRKKEKLDNIIIDKQSLKSKLQKSGIDGIHLFHLDESDSTTAYTRNFSTMMDLAEEPATGTANGSLIFLLKKRGILKNNSIKAIQGEAMGRESNIYCDINEKMGKYDVEVGGKGRVVLEGIIHV